MLRFYHRCKKVWKTIFKNVYKRRNVIRIENVKEHFLLHLLQSYLSIDLFAASTLTCVFRGCHVLAIDQVYTTGKSLSGEYEPATARRDAVTPIKQCLTLSSKHTEGQARPRVFVCLSVCLSITYRHAVCALDNDT